MPKIAEDEIVLPTPPTTVDSDVSDEQTTEDRNVAENENRGEDSRNPKRIHTIPKHLDGYVLDGGLEDDANYTVDYCYRVADIQTTYNDAIKSNEATKWQKAMHDEMTALYDNEGRQIVVGGNGFSQLKPVPRKKNPQSAMRSQRLLANCRNRLSRNFCTYSSHEFCSNVNAASSSE